MAFAQIPYLSTDTLPSCFDKTTQQYTALLGRQAALLYAEWSFGKENDLNWEELDVFEQDIIKTTICEQCNN